MAERSDTFDQALNAAIPRCLDSVITRNRDLARLYLATEEQIAALSRIIPPVPKEELRGAVSDWRFITYQVTPPGEEAEVHVHLLGDNHARKAGTKITSAVVGIDLGSRLVATHSGSLYRLVGERGVGEPTLYQLLQLCGAMWSWGRGATLGVTHVFY